MSRGTRSEMDALAEQAGRLVGGPIKFGANNPQARFSRHDLYRGRCAWCVDRKPDCVCSIVRARRRGTIAPTVSAFPDESSRAPQNAADYQSPDSPYLQASARMAAQQVAAGAPNAATNAQMATERAAAFSSDAQAQLRMSGGQVAAGASDVVTSARMTADRAAAFSTDAASQLQMGGAQIAAGAPIVATSGKMAADRATAFSSDFQAQSQMASAQLAAGTPFMEASARLAQQQAQARAAMGFSMPSLLTMPQMPPMLSLGPSLNMPSFAPMSVGFDLMASPMQAGQETKQVVVQESEPLRDNSSLFIQARKLLGARNYRDAEKTYLKALSSNPADAARKMIWASCITRKKNGTTRKARSGVRWRLIPLISRHVTIWVWCCIGPANAPRHRRFSVWVPKPPGVIVQSIFKRHCAECFTTR